MNRPPISEFQDIINFAASLLSEATGRALVVLGAARLEEEVRDVLVIACPGLDSEQRSHSYRIDVLVSTGVLSQDVAFCLKKVARIRNYFAHSSSATGLGDSKVASEVASLYSKLEQTVGLSALSGSMFTQMIGKIPHGLPPTTWVDDDFKKYQTSIVLLLWHLVIVRHNVPTRPIPLQMSRDGYW